MTLILSFITSDAVFQISDRRLANPDDPMTSRTTKLTKLWLLGAAWLSAIQVVKNRD